MKKMANQQANSLSDQQNSSTSPSSVSPAVTTSLHLSPSSQTSSSSINPPVHPSPSINTGTLSTHSHLSPSSSPCTHVPQYSPSLLSPNASCFVPRQGPSSLNSSNPNHSLSPANPYCSPAPQLNAYMYNASPSINFPSDTPSRNVYLSPSSNQTHPHLFAIPPNQLPHTSFQPPLVPTTSPHHRTPSFSSVFHTPHPPPHIRTPHPPPHVRTPYPPPHIRTPYPPSHVRNLSNAPQIQASTNTGTLNTHSHLSPSSGPFTHVPVLPPPVTLAPSSTPNLYTPFPAPYSSISSLTHQLLTPSFVTPHLNNPLSPTPHSMESMKERLFEACKSGDYSLVQSLIEDGANVNFLMNSSRFFMENDVYHMLGKTSPLMMASTIGHTGIVKLLLFKGAQVNLQNNEGETALMKASRWGRVKLARVLIEHGAQLNLQNKLGETALMKVSRSGHVEIAKVLIEHGAQVNLQDSFGESALMKASHNGYIVNARLLLENGADANLKSTNGNTALSNAEREEMLDLLMLASIPQLIELLLPISHKWKDLGKQLGLDEATLGSFQTTNEEKEFQSRLQAVMTTWSKQTHPHDPTWRGLIRAVKSVDTTIGKKIDRLHLQESINIRMKDSVNNNEELDSEEEENDEHSVDSIHEAEHLAAVQLAMKIKGILEHTLVHGVFVGPAGSGKSSLMSRLVGEMPSSTSPSTGVANRVVQVEVRKSSSIAVSVLNAFSNSTWLKILYDEEAIRFMTQVASYITNQKTTSTLIDQTHSLPVTPTSCARDDDEQNLAPNITPSFVNTQDDTSLVSQNDTESAASTTLSYPSGYVAPMGVFRNALRQRRLKELRQHFENSWSLYLTDTGGQMEFQEVLPLLVSGPSVFFITFRLDQDLNQRFTIEYRLPGGGRSKPYESSLTVEETILQTLASVASMGTFTYKGPQMKSVPLKPKVLIVGTHKDKLDKATAESKMKEMDKYLQKLIKSTSHYREDLVEFSSESQLIFTVNNLSEDDSDFKKIRSSVERVVQRSNFKMSYPSHWLIFSLIVRQQMIKESVISFDECFAIAQDCGITDHEELNHALWFLHTKIGLVRHFPTPDLKDTVIRDPQVLFDQVTHLIVKTFTFENVSERRSTEFKKRGIFLFEDFKSAIQSSSHFLPPEKLLLLLEQLRIVAPFQTDEGQTKYFLPCVLAHSEVCTSPVLTSNIPPLLITFKCGYCPKGLTGALIIYLLTNEMGSKFKWELKTDQIFRDQVSFLVSPYDFVTLKIHPTFLECVHFRPFPKSAQMSNHNKTYSIERVCNRVRHFIKKGIKKVSSELKFTTDAKPSLSFFCQDTDCVKSNGPHSATDCTRDEDRPCSLRCNKSGVIVISFPPAGCSVWFGKEYQEECDQDAELKDTDGGQSSMSMDIPTSKHHGRPPVDTCDDLLSSAPKRPKISSQSPNGVSSAVGLEGESMDLVPQDDSVECSGQFESRGSVTGPEEQTITLDESDWATVCGYLYKMDRDQIKRLGGELGLNVYNLEKMQDLPGDMVKAWLRKENDVQEKCGDPLTWNVLVEKLKKIGQTGIARAILRDKWGQSQ